MWHQNMDDSVLAKEANNLIKQEREEMAALTMKRKSGGGDIITARDSYQHLQCQA